LSHQISSREHTPPVISKSVMVWGHQSLKLVGNTKRPKKNNGKPEDTKLQILIERKGVSKGGKGIEKNVDNRKVLGRAFSKG